MTPRAWLAQRRVDRQLDRQLPDVLMQMATALKAGAAFSQVVNQIKIKDQGILSDELERANQKLRAGDNQEEVLDNMAKRVGNKDLALAVLAINVHTRSGGNLAENLTTVAERVRERVRLRDEIRTATTQSRYSGFLLTAIPIALGLLLFFIAPTYFRPMLSSVIGALLLGTAAVLLIAGNYLMYRISEVDV